MNTTFIHIADCHLGSWRDEKLREISQKSFEKIISICIENKIDFLIISGDLFNTALPSIDVLKFTVTQLQRLKHHNIPVYCIAGSHDYSHSGKSMLEVLEEAQLIVNVLKATMTDDDKLKLTFTIDPKTNIKLCGILGRSQGLEKQYYELLDRESLEEEVGTKIFLFHSALEELKPKKLKDISAPPLSYLPKKFTYYAGGHVHYRYCEDIQPYGRIVYPGPTFPNNFAEIEELSTGSYAITTIQNEQLQSDIHQIPIKPHISIKIDVSGCTTNKITEKILSQKHDYTDAIITLRLFGKIKEGAITDIDFENIYNTFYKKGAHIILKNTTAIQENTFTQQIKISDTEHLQDDLITEHLGQITLAGLDEKEVIKKLMQKLDITRQEGETVTDFENRIKTSAKEIFTDDKDA